MRTEYSPHFSTLISTYQPSHISHQVIPYQRIPIIYPLVSTKKRHNLAIHFSALFFSALDYAIFSPCSPAPFATIPTFSSPFIAVICPASIPSVLSGTNRIRMRLSRCSTICGVSSCKLSDFTTIYSIYALFSVFSATLAVVCPSLTPLVLSRRNKTLTVAKISLISSARLAWLMYIKSILSLSCGSVL